MKKFKKISILAILIAAVFALSNCDSNSDTDITGKADDSDTQTDTGQSSTESGEWKKVALTIDVNLVNSVTTAMTCIGSGAFALDLYFPLEEATNGIADLAAQKSYFQITNYVCTGPGSEGCVVTLSESDYLPFEVIADANLQLTSTDWVIGGLSIMPLPTDDLTLHPTFQCAGSPLTMPEAGMLTQIFSAFDKRNEDRLSGFNIGMDDYNPQTMDFVWPLYLGNSAEMVLTGTTSTVRKLPN